VSASPSAANIRTFHSEGFSFLAPAALALIPALSLARLSSNHNESYEWIQHLTAGAVFFVSFASVLVGGPLQSGRAAFIGSLLTLFCLAAIVMNGLPGVHWAFFAAAAIVVAGYRYSRRESAYSSTELMALFIGSVFTFWATSRLFWWEPFESVSSSSGQIALYLAICCVIVYATIEISRSRNVRPRVSSGWYTRTIDVIALLLIAAAVSRTNGLIHNSIFPPHWGVYVTPADLVRDGRVLLGEVPSQYGFLSILLLALFPIDDLFTALFLLNSITLWASAAVVYFSLRSWLASKLWQIVAALLTICAVAFILGDASDLSGPMTYPSVGGMRFIWVDCLLGLLLWRHLQANRGTLSASRTTAFFWTGHGLWLVGALWSIESAAYVTAVWFPAASILSGIATGGPGRAVDRFKRLLRGIRKVLTETGLLLALAVLIIELFYKTHLGRTPQWHAYWEYAAAFSGGFGVLPIDSYGCVWVLIMLHGGLLAALMSFDYDRERDSIALIWGAWGALWSVSTYYISRSGGTNLTNLTPVLLLVVAVFVQAVRPHSDKNLLQPWVWLVVPSFLASVVWLVASRPAVLQRQLVEYAVQPKIAALRRPVSGALTALIQGCLQAKPDRFSVAAFSSDDSVTVEAFSESSEWIPISSLSLFNPLPLETRFAYLDLYTENGKKSGWFIVSIDRHAQSLDWLFQYVRSRYKADIRLSNKTWEAWHCVPLENHAQGNPSLP